MTRSNVRESNYRCIKAGWPPDVAASHRLALRFGGSVKMRPFAWGTVNRPFEGVTEY